MGRVTVLAVAVVLAGVVCLTSARPVPAEPAVARAKWEYRIDNWGQVAKAAAPNVEWEHEWTEDHFRRGLAIRGDEGWELTGVQGEGRKARYYFKRPK
jgi:hypothetical protein